MGYSTGVMRPEERDQVLALLSDNLSGLRGLAGTEHYRWSHHDNPAGPAGTIVVRHQSPGSADVVVGCGSVYPRRLRVQGHDVLAAIPADFAVARQHRFGGAALAVQRAVLELFADRFALFLAFPNTAALPVLRRVGYLPIATAHAWVKPLSAAYKVEPYLRSRPLADALSRPLDFVLSNTDAWRLRQWPVLASEVVDRADERFDRLWSRTRDRYGAAGERTSAYLNWRYRARPASTHRFFCVTTPDGTDLVGYTVFDIRDRKVFVDDLFAADPDDSTERLLLQLAVVMRRARHQSICVVFAGNDAFKRLLGRLGFIERPTTSRALVGLATESSLTPLLDESRWLLFEGEMDV